MTEPSPTHPTPATTAAFLTAPRRSRAERRKAGKALRAGVPRESHAELPARADRSDPVALLRSQEEDREPALVPLRYERMVQNPFAFLRGAALVMAEDLSSLPRTPLDAQLCGDAHLSNVGMFAAPDRRLVLDVNDFDETLSGPFDWDVKRLAASVAVAGLVNGSKSAKVHRAAVATVQTYRETVKRIAQMPTLDAWYARIDVAPLLDRLRGTDLEHVARRSSAKAWRNTGEVAVEKLTSLTDAGRRFRSDPPLLVPVEEAEQADLTERVVALFTRYLGTLQADRSVLLLRYRIVDLAHKVVGVGSVGTRALVVLLESGDGEPLLLQVKQAGPSVLERYLHTSRVRHRGQRVVLGQRLLQATSDPFLGWTTGSDGVAYYVRQLRDMKGSIDPSRLDAGALLVYGQLCGAVLARAHARAGDASMLAGYLGGSAEFDEAVGEFARGYADITVADHAQLVRAHEAGKLRGLSG